MSEHQISIGSQYHGDAGTNKIYFCDIIKYYFRLCQLSYSHILHVENLSSEWKMFLSDIKINENITLPWNNKSTDDSYQKYIEQLTEEEKEQLCSKYEADFMMFGYKMMSE